jgi:hypothetical protein
MAQSFRGAPFRWFTATSAGFESSDLTKFPHPRLRRDVCPDDYFAGQNCAWTHTNYKEHDQ